MAPHGLVLFPRFAGEETWKAEVFQNGSPEGCRFEMPVGLILDCDPS
jgi:hypothetical protein